MTRSDGNSRLETERGEERWAGRQGRCSGNPELLEQSARLAAEGLEGAMGSSPCRNWSRLIDPAASHPQPPSRWQGSPGWRAQVLNKATGWTAGQVPDRSLANNPETKQYVTDPAHTHRPVDEMLQWIRYWSGSATRHRLRMGQAQQNQHSRGTWE
ncbi:hypothetical protein ACOMHN_034780 [Nucella lapillus]